MTAGALLEVRDLSIGFATDSGLARVLDGVNLSVGRGAIMGLVGESGCGKTTLARAVLGILAPNAMTEAGAIRFDGQDLLGMPRERLQREVKGRRIAFVPQDPYGAFNPLFRVGDQIMELMKWKSPLRDKDERGLGALLDALSEGTAARGPGGGNRPPWRGADPGSRACLGKLPGQFSGGQRQRLMFAMALLTKPDLIIADEPTTALDVTIQAQILKLLRSLAKDRGVSVLLTTHDLGTAYEICDDITVMYAGQEVETAAVAEFFANPRHPYTARLLESLPDPAREMQEIGGEIPNLLSPPTGCRFLPRCRSASAQCDGDAAAGLGRPPDGALLSSAAAAAGGALVSAQAPLLQVPIWSGISRCTTRSGCAQARRRRSTASRSMFGPAKRSASSAKSGCGKTTLGKTLAGIHKPSAGRIVFETADISGLQGAARGPVVQRLQYIHQDSGSALDPRWTIGRSLDEPLVITRS